MNDHPRYRDDIGAYLLGALTELERQAFERHMAGCSECQEELERLRPAADALPGSVEQVQPPARLKASLMEVVEREAEAEREAEPERKPAPSRRPRRLFLRPAFVAAGLLIALAIGVAVTQQHILHVRGIEPQLLQPRDHDGLDPVGVAGVDQDDALRRGDGIHRCFRVADGVDIVEQPHRFQLRSRPCRLRCPSRPSLHRFRARSRLCPEGSRTRASRRDMGWSDSAFRRLSGGCYTPCARFSTYIYRVVTNNCLNEIRRLDHEKTVPGETRLLADDTTRAPDHLVMDREIVSRIADKVLDLPFKQRAALLLSRVEGFDHREVASCLGVSEFAVKSLVFRATRTLREAMNEGNGEQCSPRPPTRRSRRGRREL